MAKSKRPEGWNPSAVLEWLESHQGAAIGDLCRAFETDDFPSYQLAHDVHRWRNSDDAFRLAFDGMVKNEVRGSGQELDAPAAGLEDWMLPWAKRYLDTDGDKIEASRFVGLSWGHVQRYTRKTDKRYFSQHFTDLVAQVQSYFVSGWETDVNLGLRIARETGDARTLLFGALKALEVRNPEVWGRQQTVRLEGSVEHKHTLEIRQAQSQVEERARLLFAKPIAALPAPPIELSKSDRPMVFEVPARGQLIDLEAVSK